MKIVLLTLENIDQVAAEAALVLSRGGIIVYPTDTIYGLGSDALDDEATKKVYTLKGRNQDNTLSCMVSGMQNIEQLGLITEDVEKIALSFLPGPLTLVITKHDNVTTGIAAGRNTIGIRIPNHPFSLTLAKTFGKPITATSANISGMPTEDSVEKILAQFGDTAGHIDLVIDAGILPPSPPSTVVNMSVTPPQILRQGAISPEKIFEALR